MQTPIQAHPGQITLLSTSRGVRRYGDPKIGWFDRLVSSGADAKIKVWEVQDSPIDGAITLVNLKMVNIPVIM